MWWAITAHSAFVCLLALFLNVHSQENNGNGESDITAEYYFVTERPLTLTDEIAESCASQCLTSSATRFCYGIKMTMQKNGNFKCTLQTTSAAPSLTANDSYLVLGTFPFANGKCENGVTLDGVTERQQQFDSPHIRVWQNKVYYFIDSPLYNYSECQQVCAGFRGAHIPTVSSLDEHNYLRDVTSALSYSTALYGIENIRIPINIRTFVPKQWEWRDGTNISIFSKWANGNPSNYAENDPQRPEECAGLRGFYDSWNDYECKYAVNCACEDNVIT